MGVRVEEIKVILRGRSAYALFMGWLKATRPDLTDVRMRQLVVQHTLETREFALPVYMKTKTSISDLWILLHIARRNNITVFCEGEAFALEGRA